MRVTPIVWTAAVVCALPAYAASCESLASLSLPDAKITAAQVVAAGAFSPPTGGRADVYKSVPEFCRVAATLTPSSDSDIKVEVWLPTTGWNRKFQAVGNGGWAGVISYGAMGEAVKAGYATVSTDTGHSTQGGGFALGHPEKLIDFGWRSEHEMTVKAKAIVQAFLWQRAAAIVLERMFHRRPASAQGSADVSGRFRRHHRGRGGQSNGDGNVDRARAAEGSGEPHPAGEISR